MLSICTFKWGDKYTLEHCTRWARMMRRNLTPGWFELVLITDRPEEAGDDLALGSEFNRIIPLWSAMSDAKLCGVRLHAFHPSMRELIGPRFAWVDLDVVVTGNVDHIFGRATPQGPLWYNGSLIMMDAGARPQVESLWTPQAYAALPARYAAQGMRHGGQSDEGWMTAVLGPNEARVGPSDGIRYFKHLERTGSTSLPPDTCMVIMNGLKYDPSMPKWQGQYPWIAKHWR